MWYSPWSNGIQKILTLSNYFLLYKKIILNYLSVRFDQSSQCNFWGNPSSRFGWQLSIWRWTIAGGCSRSKCSGSSPRRRCPCLVSPSPPHSHSPSLASSQDIIQPQSPVIQIIIRVIVSPLPWWRPPTSEKTPAVKNLQRRVDFSALRKIYI